MASDKRNRKLLREIEKIERFERSNLRMIETIRHRFRSRLKKYEVPQFSSGSDLWLLALIPISALSLQANDVRMYDTHNPGFCYHCTGAIRAGDKRPRRISSDVYDAVYSMLFTDGEVDPDKVLCLHVLTAHCADSGSGELMNVRRAASFTDEGKQQSFGGAWNNILPCYVVELERNVDDVTDFSDEVKRHKDPVLLDAENEIVKEFQGKYEKYLTENPEVGLALSTNRKLTTMLPNDIGKLTIIPPHVYSLLGAAQELKIKQAIAEESRRKRFRRDSSNVVKNVDDQSISFRLDDDEDEIPRRVMTATSIRGWTTQRFAGTSRISAFQSLSRKSATSSRRTDPSITTLKRASPHSSGVPLLSTNLQETGPQIVTIKPSTHALSTRVSKTSSTKSPFQNFPSTLGPLSPCSNSIFSGVSGPLEQPRKIRRPIFINYPTTSIELRNKEYETVPILVNNQMQALVHSVMDVLERVNPAKMRKIVATASSRLEIRKMLIRPDIQAFIESLAGQPLVSSPSSFVTSMASSLYEIDPRIESSIEKELVAKTLPVPAAPALHRLVKEIRNNLFVDPNAASGKGPKVKVESFGSQRQKLLESRPCKGSCEEKDVFDVDNSCPHSE
ncbi:uncharacterized protein LOC124416269 [Diprion similis]|uniref:uncharacterized protein LOC124416269 n=1 Tax=Diprion similis TaxID=362088 RepID=UPI001EF83169|nr:uncharacterized protein LOC124416269 [Diprion similis]